MNARAFSKLVIILLIVSLSGCKQYTTTKKVNAIEAAITSYDVAMRWAQYPEAYRYHVSPNGTQPPADLDALKELSVTGVKVIEKILNEDKTEANVKTEVSYFFKDEGTLRKLKLQQRWWVKEETNQWFIDGEFPKFR
ncbi:MAG: hypothetical protein DHS20C09_11010 [marine bacterium B5-7]|nr:MAG: hypothetical protein DHS20C09_11010 [marine bacterium B5-7]